MSKKEKELPIDQSFTYSSNSKISNSHQQSVPRNQKKKKEQLYFFSLLADSACALMRLNCPPSFLAAVAALTSLQWFINLLISCFAKSSDTEKHLEFRAEPRFGLFPGGYDHRMCLCIALTRASPNSNTL